MPTIADPNQNEYAAQLQTFLQKIQSGSEHYIGYPAGMDFDYHELYPFLNYNLNNVGDPFIDQYDMHSKQFEREVIQFFAELAWRRKTIFGAMLPTAAPKATYTPFTWLVNFTLMQWCIILKPPTTACRKTFTSSDCVQ
jgi:hypothetical protein